MADCKTCVHNEVCENYLNEYGQTIQNKKGFKQLYANKCPFEMRLDIKEGTAEFIRPQIILKINYPATAAGRAQWSKDYGMNAYYTGKHWSQRKKDAAYFHQLVTICMKAQRIKKRTPAEQLQPVDVEFYWNDRLDIDNHAAMGKMIIDAMKGVLIKDDNRKYLKSVKHSFHNENYIKVVLNFGA